MGADLGRLRKSSYFVEERVMSFIRNLFSSPSAPSYPDPAQTIAAQSASNEATARLQAGLNRPDVYGPGGSTTWTDLGNDRWRSDVTLSPAS